MTYLGESLDIHGGGQDLVFPHHENEIAQSEASTGVVPFSRYWVHNGLLRLGGDKMSKSLGNLVSVEEALEQFSPDAIRPVLPKLPLPQSPVLLRRGLRGHGAQPRAPPPRPGARWRPVARR